MNIQQYILDGHSTTGSFVDLYADLRAEEEPILNASRHEGSLMSVNSLPVPKNNETAIFQSAVFIEDAVNYRSIHHKIDPHSLKLYRVYYSRYIQWALGIVIFVNLILAFFEFPTSMSLSADFRFRDHTWHMSEPKCGVTESVEVVCLLFFLADCTTQFYLLGLRRFVKKRWLLLYSVMIVLSFVDLIISLSFCPEKYDFPHSLGYTIRVRRYFRPLFFLLSSSIMKKFIKAINLTLPHIFTVLILLLLHLYVFTMFGLLVFPRHQHSHDNAANQSNGSEFGSGAFGTFDNLTNSSNACSVVADYSAGIYAHKEGEKYFNTVTDGLVNLLVLLTTANHPDIMMPIYQYNRFSALYFIVFLVIGMYLILNLLIAVVYNNFRGFFLKSLQSSFFRRRVAFRAAFTILARRTPSSSPSQELVSRNLVRQLLQKAKIYHKQVPLMYHKLETLDLESECLTWVQFREVFDLVSRDPHKKVTESSLFYSNSRTLQWLQFIIRHRYFAYLTYGVSVVHVFLITIELQIDYDDSFHSPTSRLSYYNFVFITYYVLEQIFKVVGLGQRGYFASMGNIYEGIITITLLILEVVMMIVFGAPFTDPDDLNVQRLNVFIRIINILIIFRLLRVIPHIKSLSLLTGTMIDLVKNLRGFAGIIVVIYYLFALLGMELFMRVDGCLEGDAKASLICGKYENLMYYANSFHDFASSLVVLWDVMVVNNWYVFLEKFGRDSSLGDWSKLYFIAWWLVSVVVSVNLFVSLVLETFMIKWEAEQGRKAEERRSDEPHERFSDSSTWSTHSSGEGTQISDIHNLLRAKLVEPEEADIMHELQQHRDVMLV